MPNELVGIFGAEEIVEAIKVCCLMVGRSKSRGSKVGFNKEDWIRRFNAHALISICVLLHHGLGLLCHRIDDIQREF